MESLAWKASDRRSLKVADASVSAIARVGLITVNVCNKQQIDLGDCVTVSGAKVDLLLRMQLSEFNGQPVGDQ